MNKFSYGVSDFVKRVYKNDMLLKDMMISRPMTHAQQVEGVKVTEQAKEKNNIQDRDLFLFSIEIGWWNSLAKLEDIFIPYPFASQCSILQEQV